MVQLFIIDLFLLDTTISFKIKTINNSNHVQFLILYSRANDELRWLWFVSTNLSLCSEHCCWKNCLFLTISRWNNMDRWTIIVLKQPFEISFFSRLSEEEGLISVVFSSRNHYSCSSSQEIFHVSSRIMSSMSPVFETMLSTPMIEAKNKRIELQEEDPRCCSSFVDCWLTLFLDPLRFCCRVHHNWNQFPPQ